MNSSSRTGKPRQKKSIYSRLTYKLVKNNIVSSVIAIYYAVTIFIFLAFYPISQILLNYPKNNEEISRSMGTSNLAQYILIMILSLTIGTIILLRAMKDFKNWEKLNPNVEEDRKKIRMIRQRAINLPYVIFLAQSLVIGIPLIPILLTVMRLNNLSVFPVVKLLILSLSLLALAAVVSHTSTRKVFKIVLLNTYLGGENEGFRINLKNKIFFQIIPMLFLVMLYTAFIGYSTLIEEKGDMVYNIFKTSFSDFRFNGNDPAEPEHILKLLEEHAVKGTDATTFVKTNDGELFTAGNIYIGGYLNYFIDKPYEGDRIFDINAEIQGIVKTINVNGQEWKAGYIFEVDSNKAILSYFIGFILLLSLNVFVLYFFSKTFSEDISLVAESLTDIVNKERVELEKKLPVTSNDEIGDLVIAFNKIQAREIEHVREMKEQQAVLVERERLASLGQLIGGIAHNLRTPIMSIAGAIEGLKDLVREYEESVGDEDVSEEDHHEIASEMMGWLEKAGPYCSYMSDMISAVKAQTVQANDTENLSFTVGEVTERVELLMHNEVKRSLNVLKTDYKADPKTIISGDISIIVQVINNLITNAIQSYENTGGNEIQFSTEIYDGMVEFMVRDSGSGIPEETKDKLFKEMVTTKGKEGTGLGLFISYSNIKARFRGKMWFESEEGKGTTFHVAIPYIKKGYTSYR